MFEVDELPFQKVSGSSTETQPLFQLKGETESSKASNETVALVKDLLKRIGVDIKQLENIVVDGIKQDANGAALIMQKLVLITEGKENVALTEEAMLAQALSTSWGHHFSNHYKEAFSFSQKIKADSIILNFFIKTIDYEGRNEIERYTNELNYYYMYIKSFLC